MADLNIVKSDNVSGNEEVGQNKVFNGGFESSPSFTAATNTAARWIDGTAAGSTINDTWRWGTFNSSGSTAIWTAQFDTSQFNSDSVSMKLSTIASAAIVEVSPFTTVTLATFNSYGIPVMPSTSYRYSYYMKTNYVSGDSNDGAFMIWQQRDSAITALTSTTTTKVKVTTGWTFYTGVITTDSTAAFMHPRMRLVGSTGAGTLVMDAWYDDLSFSLISPNIALPLGPIITPGIQDITGPKIWS